MNDDILSNFPAKKINKFIHSLLCFFSNSGSTLRNQLKYYSARYLFGND